jgi:hypothetical protein
VLSLIVLAGIGGVLGTYFGDRAAHRRHEEDQARVVKLQAAVDAQSLKLDTIGLLLQAQLERPTPSSPYNVRPLWSPAGQVVRLDTTFIDLRPCDFRKSKLNSLPVTTTFYVDKNVQPDSTYYYAVTAVNALGQESLRSNEIQKAMPVGPQ